MDKKINKRVFRARTASGEPDPVDLHVGMRLRLRRTMLGLSQTELANEVSLAFQQVQKYESGHNRVSASRLYYIAEALGVHVAFFFDDLNLDNSDLGLEEEPSLLLEDENTRKSLEMMRNYHRITDPAIQRSICDLIKSLAQNFEEKES